MQIPGNKRLTWLFNKNPKMKELAKKYEAGEELSVHEKIKLVSFITGKDESEITVMFKFNILLDELKGEKNEA